MDLLIYEDGYPWDSKEIVRIEVKGRTLAQLKLLLEEAKLSTDNIKEMV